MPRLLAFFLACLVVSVCAPGAHAAPGLTLGFNDERLSQQGTPADLAEAFPRARAAGAGVWRVEVQWQRVAPTQPPTAAAAADPGWSGYNWTRLDTVVRQATASGLAVLPYPRLAPAWAEGAGRPPVSRLVPAGTWRPNPTALGLFATAMAKRYSGTYPDPATPGATLPRIAWFQAWNEPNLYTDLNPQWTRTSSGWKPAGPAWYRRMANAFYAGIKRGAPTAKVLSAGTGPFGDLNEGDPRMPPVRFWRELLCIRDGEVPRTTKCGASVKFDGIAHHPYPIGPPRRTARNKDDAVVPDVRKITRLLPAALRGGTLKPRTAKPLWITEYAWESSPDPDGLSLAEQALYLEGSLYILWRQGASTVIWWQMRDDAGTAATWASTFQSGIFLRGASPAQDQAKPSYTAYRFPFTAYRSDGVARLWGKTPSDLSVTIQAQQGGSWVTAARLKAGSNRIFTGRLRVGPNTPLRAVAGPDTSLVWRTQ